MPQKTTISLLLIAFSLAATAQGVRYERPTITRMVTSYNDGYDRRVVGAFSPPREEQFFHNKINTTTVPISGQRDKRTYNSQTGKYSYHSLSEMELTRRNEEILRYLNHSNVGLQQLSTWFNRAEDGTMDMELVHFRGEYSATDQAFISAEATKRGRDELRDMGEALIANTFIFVYDYTNVRREVNSEGNTHSYNSAVYLYIFAIAAPQEAVSALYSTWIDEDDPPMVRAQKNDDFSDIKVPLKFVSVHRLASSQSGALSGSSAAPADVLLVGMVRGVHHGLMDRLEKSDHRFIVQSPVFSVRPITSKIGLKEGLRKDQRYFIYENVLKNNEVKQVRKGVARVGATITDNRRITDGGTIPSHFYQVAGQRIEPGMSLRYNRGGEFRLLGGYGGITTNGQRVNGWGRVEFGIRGVSKGNGLFFGYMDFEHLSGSYEMPLLQTIDLDLLRNLGVTEKSIDKFSTSGGYRGEAQNVGSWRFSLGAGRDWHPLRNLQTSFYGGIGSASSRMARFDERIYDGDTTKNVGISVTGLNVKVGLDFAVNVWYPIQIVGGVSAYAHTHGFGSGLDKDIKTGEQKWDDAEVKAIDPFAALRKHNTNGHRDYFTGLRATGLVTFLGVRVCF